MTVVSSVLEGLTFRFHLARTAGACCSTSLRNVHLRLLELENLLNLSMALVPSRELTKTLWGAEDDFVGFVNTLAMRWSSSLSVWFVIKVFQAAVHSKVIVDTSGLENEGWKWTAWCVRRVCFALKAFLYELLKVSTCSKCKRDGRRSLAHNTPLNKL